jgi:hypothetical protein
MARLWPAEDLAATSGRIVQMPPPMISDAEKTNDLDIVD